MARYPPVSDGGLLSVLGARTGPGVARSASSNLIVPFGYLLLILILTSLNGCGLTDSLFEPDPSEIVATLEASTDVNPDSSGRPSPIVARVYELTSAGVFQSADFFSLYDQDVILLEKDLKARDEIRLRPGEKKTISRELDPATRFVGIIAAYRNLDYSTWRASFEIVPETTTTVTVYLGGTGVVIWNEPR